MFNQQPSFSLIYYNIGVIFIVDLTNFNPEYYMSTVKTDKNRRDYRLNPQVQSPIIFGYPNYVYPMISFLQEVIINHDYLDIIPNYYIINNYGELRTINGEMLTPKLINSGYYVYYVRSKLNKIYPILAHRLVLMVFNPVANMEVLTVDHQNGNKLDIDLSNLRWCTQKENNDYRALQCSRVGGVNHYKSMFTYGQLKLIVDELDNGTSYDNILIKLNLPITRNNRDYIGNIKRGITYKREVSEIREKKVQRLSKG
jgi:hypothetical protein